MKFPQRLSAPLLLALTLSGPAGAAIIDLSNNLSQASQGAPIVGNTQWTAERFTTTADAYVLKLVTVQLLNLYAITGNFGIDVWSATGTEGRPGAWVTSLGSGSASAIGTSATAFSLTNLSATLAPSTSYYLVLRGLSLTDYINWYGTTSGSGTGFPSVSTYTTNSGTSWVAPMTTYQQKMQIQADQVSVPEPTALSLAALGLAGLGLSRRRRATT